MPDLWYYPSNCQIWNRKHWKTGQEPGASWVWSKNITYSIVMSGKNMAEDKEEKDDKNKYQHKEFT
jgi:hypothetical protein